MATENEYNGMDLLSLYKQTGAFPPQLQNSLGSVIGYDPFTLICAHQDRFIGVGFFKKKYRLNDFAVDKNCRGVASTIDPKNCKVILTCAEEEPTEDCSAVKVRIGYQVILPKPYDYDCALVVTGAKDFYIKKFFSVSTNPGIGHHVPTREALKIADGSCVQVWLDCNVEGDWLIVTGFIIDKLWKKENLLIGAPAFRLNNTVTVDSEFEQAPGPCGDGTTEPEITDLDLNA